ncbi:S9 family peptidase [Labrys wisconsinensis]|uniref:Acylaminoacyl-peptidase n=1 Tax=Labrys wisconsinensis TaxID=425677 RepID=A0ABU0J5N4_9HYPH|nr:S9 family peptidase [Labrys wisconsinensis]MDQ0469571.1 acylaminoacyl-peptidase [Labrys wisconsinensis]
MPDALIPRRILFDNPVAFDARISPDGAWYSWIAPVDGVLNLWIAPCGHIDEGRPLTRQTVRPITWHSWSNDSRHLLYFNDRNGDENIHLYAVDPAGGAVRDLTPLDGIAARWFIGSPDRPGEFVIGLNDRDPRWHDAWRLDLATGERTLLWENTQNLGTIGFDWTHRPRWARSETPDGASRLWRIEDGELHPWRDIGYEDSLATRPLFFNRANTHLHMLSSLDRDTAALLRIDWASGEESVVAEHPDADVADILWDAGTFEANAVAAEVLKAEWFHRAPAVAADLAHLEGALPGFEFAVAEQSRDDRHWIVMAHRPEQAATYLHFDREARSLVEICRARPALDAYHLAPMRPVEGRSRDGLQLVSYLTLPASVAGDRPERPLPMVLVVHGGPWGRDAYGYRGDHQFLADRGYAVLSVNYRGSTGFGKAFVAASIHEHGAKMHDDLLDMVAWAVAEGIADRDKVAIFGASYGGYASFLGATFTPEVFCCALPLVGITNLQTLLESIPPYWAGFAEFMYRSYGDPRTEEGRRLLAERSPIHRVDAITKPMLIAHGQNDVRCKVAESDTIVAAMQARGIPVTYIVYPDEGHGLTLPANRLAYWAIMEAFLARHLGGACEPVGHDLEGSSHEIRAGREDLAGLGIVGAG